MIHSWSLTRAHLNKLPAVLLKPPFHKLYQFNIAKFMPSVRLLKLGKKSTIQVGYYSLRNGWGLSGRKYLSCFPENRIFSGSFIIFEARISRKTLPFYSIICFRHESPITRITRSQRGKIIPSGCSAKANLQSLSRIAIHSSGSQLLSSLYLLFLIVCFMVVEAVGLVYQLPGAAPLCRHSRGRDAAGIMA